MKINLENIKTIDLCYENCEVDTVYFQNLLGIKIPKKMACIYTYQNKPTFSIKTFEIALQDNNHVLKDTQFALRTDLAQLTINYLDGSFDHFFIVWDKKDCEWGYSSLQKVHNKGNCSSLTSNCTSTLLL